MLLVAWIFNAILPPLLINRTLIPMRTETTYEACFAATEPRHYNLTSNIYEEVLHMSSREKPLVEKALSFLTSIKECFLCKHGGSDLRHKI